METLVTVVHYFICIFLVIVILLQVGKGADVGAAFGAGGSQTFFGPRGAATFLNKVTAVVAVVFLGTSLLLASMAQKGATDSVLGKVPPPPATETSPTETGPTETAPKTPETSSP